MAIKPSASPAVNYLPSTRGFAPNEVNSNIRFSPIRVQDPALLAALSLLEETINPLSDAWYLTSLGITLPFQSGREAITLLRSKQVHILFDKLTNPNTHAIWLQGERKLVINERYRGNMSIPVLCAIAQAIYHEAGHITHNGDNISSIQEELNCLALNVLAYRSHLQRYPQLLQTAVLPYNLRPLFENGVALYNQLFFDPDPNKTALINRIIDKYGSLKAESTDHPIPTHIYNASLTQRIVTEIQQRQLLTRI